MTDYETLKVSNTTYKCYFSDDESYDEDEFKTFDIVDCPNCPNNNEMMTTDDGNRNQTCLSCKTVLMVDGKLVNQTENKNNITTQKKEDIKKYTDGELEIYSEDDPDMPDYMKELSELINQKK